ncbi:MULTISPECIES: response regulator transcription factor [Cryobacterium]|uniref:DNA-binding response regulator, OmpR family, contains REC and winged-helix (WHTH) domain n=1 Tax=Cryobacterium levicorallinum TaxID=995038 RepID=A0A1I3AWK0_9MICO|nr:MULTISPECIES: response regulator transcription factor [Cryobacterium]TFB87930.1 response regulator transcription factor [Cryobacterium levicorallinum]TFD54223.1 response regulator transcription factor [Cryobacterium sp. Hh7]TFD56444.1 response regulator transcription factor [Cryobacterium sp. Hh38]SFH54447.1 DNA-binding response regulator, OmpR family, contains REC and winged-helix (wHTH) domain [Cryobacterium levicorallinum]GEP26889.1 DNA-binding response regulator [Cryobacterium levicoral
MTSILIAEDEARIALFVSKGLRAAGYSSTVVDDGLDAVSYAQSGTFDLLLLDVGLPSIDGFEVMKRIRAERLPLPIIMLTARSTTSDMVAGLDGGADDYLAKPFKFDELLARIRLRLRDAEQSSPTRLAYGELALDLRTRRATVGERTVELSAREFALAEEFLRHPDQVLSREQLLSRVWGYDFDPGSNVVDVYVRYLRAKFGPERIETVRGMGYRLK